MLCASTDWEQPRAFYTPLLRDIRVPNTSYGEDYALDWLSPVNTASDASMRYSTFAAAGTGNSDAALSIEKNQPEQQL